MLDLFFVKEHKDHHDEHNTVSANNSETNQHQATPPPPPRMSDDELTKVIDEIMLDEDKNKDGFITYQEFLHAIKQ